MNKELPLQCPAATPRHELPGNILVPADPAAETDPIILAVSAQWHSFPAKLDWLVSNGFAIEYTPDSRNLATAREHLPTYLAEGVRIRHHGYFPGFEFGDSRPDRAEEALNLHLRALETIQGIGEPFVTFHVGLIPDIPVNPTTAVRNLATLVDYGKKLGITVSLENLRFGPTSNPETVLEWTGKTGAMITMDVGHAVSCDRVNGGELTVCEIVNLFRKQLGEVHFYESETDRHHAPNNMDILGPVVDALLTSDCRWWTIELDTRSDVLQTQQLLADHLTAKRQMQKRILPPVHPCPVLSGAILPLP